MGRLHGCILQGENTGFGSKLPDFLTAMARELSAYVGLIPADSEQLFGHEGVVLPRYAGRFGLKPHADEARFELKYFFKIGLNGIFLHVIRRCCAACRRIWEKTKKYIPKKCERIGSPSPWTASRTIWSWPHRNVYVCKTQNEEL